MVPPVGIAILKLVEMGAKHVNDNPKLRSTFLKGAQSIDDWMQVKLGNVNNHSLNDATLYALSTAKKHDKDTTCKILACITALYLSHEVNRSAICGGTLLKYIGEDTFPHIESQELRFAKILDANLFQSLLTFMHDNYDEILKDFVISDELGQLYLNTHGASQAVVANVADFGLNVFGSGVISKIVKLFT